MTVSEPQTVLAILEEAPQMRVYHYRHAITGRTLYALFPPGQYDDIREAPDVHETMVLFDHGAPTGTGKAWLHDMKQSAEARRPGGD